MRGLLRRLKCDNYKFCSCFLHHTSGVAQSGMMKEYILDTTTPISSNIFMKHSKNIWEKPMVMVYQEDVIKLHCTLQEYPPLMEMFCAARWVVKDALLRYKSKRQFFLHVVPKRTSLSTESRNIQTNRIVCGYSFARRTRPLCRWKLSKSILKSVLFRRVYGGSYQQPRRIL
jgi:hypothetical protein